MDARDAMRALHDAAGARWAEAPGRDGGAVAVVRSYGDPAAEYAAARHSAVVVERADRACIRMFGRDPLKMIQGLVTNDVAGAPADHAVYALLLTPKGKMLADLRVIRRADDLLLDVAVGAFANTADTLRRFVPPLYARWEDATDAYGMLGVYGPESRAVVGAAIGVVPPGGRGEDALAAGTFEGAPVLCIRTLYTDNEGCDLMVPRAAMPAAWAALTERGARPAGHATLDVLRIEAGRPRWGAELTEDVIPIEAGLRGRAISETKGCYTGQEVIIRILHRGHVNRHLRGLLLGDAPAPAAGAVLFSPHEPKGVGRVTSACASPRLGQTIALGYVRREVTPPASVRLGAWDGPAVEVLSLPFPSTLLGEPAPRDQSS
jgi:folate-binding protein YgfZ